MFDSTIEGFGHTLAFSYHMHCCCRVGPSLACGKPTVRRRPMTCCTTCKRVTRGLSTTNGMLRLPTTRCHSSLVHALAASYSKGAPILDSGPMVHAAGVPWACYATCPLFYYLICSAYTRPALKLTSPCQHLHSSVCSKSCCCELLQNSPNVGWLLTPLAIALMP